MQAQERGASSQSVSPQSSIESVNADSQSHLQINPDLNRVFASLHNRFEPRQTNSGLGASSKDMQAQERGASSQSVSPQSSIESVNADSQRSKSRRQGPFYCCSKVGITTPGKNHAVYISSEQWFSDWRFKTANPCHNSVENGSAVCLKQKERGSNFTSDANTGDIYVLTLKNKRIPSEESRKKNSFRSKQKHWWIWSFVAVALVVATLLLGFFCYLRWRNLKRMEQEGERKTNQDKFMFLLRSKITPFSERNNSEKFGFGKNKGQQLQLYSLPQIAAATKNFSINKKLGQGGFGEVYTSDIFSFGVLLLEIVSGKNNAVFSHLSGPLSLIEHTWDLWKKVISLELTDPVLSSQSPENELL
ncbi:hypothetical protein TEA_019901 [Camellia sinensis var. sinensis]|uniref:Serine-threonine/tyrosine-protein kinase catalytic domain-containing protein n=1 Tax=Camellia sinensis var. sinensis TaxID=542762 RepID=A0A4V6RY06_CAMSN|nr:hypothetical protein TEA_019901 [Camellia sinensis var. sinensis]